MVGNFRHRLVRSICYYLYNQGGHGFVCSFVRGHGGGRSPCPCNVLLIEPHRTSLNQLEACKSRAAGSLILCPSFLGCFFLKKVVVFPVVAQHQSEQKEKQSKACGDKKLTSQDHSKMFKASQRISKALCFNQAAAGRAAPPSLYNPLNHVAAQCGDLPPKSSQLKPNCLE